MIGALVAAWLGFAVDLPPIIHPIFIMLAAMTAAGLYGWIAGVLKVKLGVNEVISTIVLNEIAILFTVYMVNFPLRADRGTVAYSPVVSDSAKLAIFMPGSKVGHGIFDCCRPGLRRLFLSLAHNKRLRTTYVWGVRIVCHVWRHS